MAERVGFEPTVPLQVLRFSRPVHSTTLPPLRGLTLVGFPVLPPAALPGLTCSRKVLLEKLAYAATAHEARCCRDRYIQPFWQFSVGLTLVPPWSMRILSVTDACA